MRHDAYPKGLNASAYTWRITRELPVALPLAYLAARWGKGKQEFAVSLSKIWRIGQVCLAQCCVSTLRAPDLIMPLAEEESNDLHAIFELVFGVSASLMVMQNRLSAHI